MPATSKDGLRLARVVEGLRFAIAVDLAFVEFGLRRFETVRLPNGLTASKCGSQQIFFSFLMKKIVDVFLFPQDLSFRISMLYFDDGQNAIPIFVHKIYA